jgi:hypothetical protein
MASTAVGNAPYLVLEILSCVYARRDYQACACVSRLWRQVAADVPPPSSVIAQSADLAWQVLSRIDSKRSVQACACVCRLWNRVATRALDTIEFPPALLFGEAALDTLRSAVQNYDPNRRISLNFNHPLNELMWAHQPVWAINRRAPRNSGR